MPALAPKRLPRSFFLPFLAVAAAICSPLGASNLTSSGFPDPTTTRGDLIVRGASAPTRLAIGANTYFLTSNGTDAAWTAPAATPTLQLAYNATSGNTIAVASAKGLAFSNAADATDLLTLTRTFAGAGACLTLAGTTGATTGPALKIADGAPSAQVDFLGATDKNTTINAGNTATRSIVFNTHTTLGPTTLADNANAGNQLLYVVGTTGAATTGGRRPGVRFDITETSTAISNGNPTGALINFNAGATSSAGAYALSIFNNVTNVGNTFFANQVGNAGVFASTGAGGVITGHNCGIYGEAYNGAINYAVFGNAAANDSKINIGVIGTSSQTGGTAVGGYFTLGLTQPTFATAALMCDNAAQAANIFVVRDNGTATCTIADNGAMSLTPNSSTTAQALKITAANNNAALNLVGQAAPSTIANGDIWQDSTQQTISCRVAGITQAYVGTIFTSTADSTLSASTTETSFFGTGVGTLTLPANFFVAGKTVRVHTWGKYTSSASPVNWTIKLKLGSTVVGLSAASAPTALQTNQLMKCDFVLTCRTTGGSGIIMANGEVLLDAGLVPVVISVPDQAATINTAASQVLDATVTFSANTAGNAETSQVGTVEVVN